MPDVLGEYYAVLMHGCHHELSWRLLEHTPNVGEIVWCHWCHAEREVRKIVGAWRVRCKHCKYARKFGSARWTAERRAAKHARDHPGHEVTFWQSGHEDGARVCSAKEQGQQTFDDIPPF